MIVLEGTAYRIHDSESAYKEIPPNERPTFSNWDQKINEAVDQLVKEPRIEYKIKVTIEVTK